MDKPSSHQSLLSDDERKQAGNLEAPEKESACNLSCTRRILSCLGLYKEMCIGECLNNSEIEPTSKCEKAANFCCDDCLPGCVCGTALGISSCILVPFAFFADVVKGIFNTAKKCCDKEPEGSPPRKVRFEVV